MVNMHPASWHRRSIIGLVAMIAAAGACGSGGEESGRSTTTAPAAGEGSTTASSGGVEEVSGAFDIGGRELSVKCIGTGSPIVVLEPGEGEAGSEMAGLQRELSDRTQVCTYDRAGSGASDPRPEPRTFAGASDDLHRLLDVAGLEGPYVLVGYSAGGSIVLDFARRYPEAVTGVLSINPVPLASQWAARAYPLLSADEVADEKAYYAGDNGEDLDYTTSGNEYEELAAPTGVPMILLHSDVTQCEGSLDSPCAKTAELYITLGEEHAAAWPGARFEAVASRHDVHRADAALVVARIEELLNS